MREDQTLKKEKG